MTPLASFYRLAVLSTHEQDGLDGIRIGDGEPEPLAKCRADCSDARVELVAQKLSLRGEYSLGEGGRSTREEDRSVILRYESALKLLESGIDSPRA